MDFSDFTIYSAAEVSVRIQRKASYFVLNYVMIVSMLTAVSWLTFFLDPMALDARAGVALTLLLAIGVFQLILNDALPKTGYLTPSKPFYHAWLWFCEMSRTDSGAQQCTCSFWSPRSTW